MRPIVVYFYKIIYFSVCFFSIPLFIRAVLFIRDPIGFGSPVAQIVQFAALGTERTERVIVPPRCFFTYRAGELLFLVLHAALLNQTSPREDHNLISARTLSGPPPIR
jgi:hypothetical protein